MIIILLEPQDPERDTTKFIKNKLLIPHLSTGDMLRRCNKYCIGKESKRYNGY